MILDRLPISQITDQYIRKAIERIRDTLQGAALLQSNFKFFEITVASAQTNFKYAHSLGFTPKDVIETSVTGAGAVTWNYGSFDATNLDLTTDGACVIRAFIGRYS